MRLSAILLSVSTLAMAAPRAKPGQERSFSTYSRPIFPTPKSAKSGKAISAALKMVAGKVTDLDSSVKVVMGPMGAAALGDVATKGAGLGDVISKAQSTISAQGETDLVGALDISDSADGLTKSLDGLSDDLITIEPVVRQAGLSSAVVDILMQQQGNSGGLVDTVVSKLPDAAKDTAKMQTMGATAGLSRVLDVYRAGMAKMPAAPKKAANASSPAMLRKFKA
jgi:hypothetical protein